MSFRKQRCDNKIRQAAQTERKKHSFWVWQELAAKVQTPTPEHKHVHLTWIILKFVSALLSGTDATWFPSDRSFQEPNSGLTEVPHDIPAEALTVNLYGNSIILIPSEVFINLTQCTHLTLRVNQISIIERNAFRGMESLQYLDLYLNKITKLQNYRAEARHVCRTVQSTGNSTGSESNFTYWGRSIWFSGFSYIPSFVQEQTDNNEPWYFCKCSQTPTCAASQFHTRN